MGEKFIIKGYIRGKAICDNENFKIYPFYPLQEFKTLVKLNKFDNISIIGNLPTMVENKEYKLEVEYKKNGDYENYKVLRFLNDDKEPDYAESFNFISTIFNEKLAKNILSAYPNFIGMMIRSECIDVSKIYGVGEKRLKHIKNKVIENYCLFDIISEFYFYDLTFGQIKKIYNKYTSVEVVKKELKKNPYKCLCSLSGISFLTADKKILNNSPELRDSEFRMRECILHTLKQNEEDGSTWIEFKELIETCSKTTPECLKHSINIIKNDEEIYFDKTTNRVSRLKTYECEKYIANTILEILNNSKKINVDYNKYNEVDGLPLTNMQIKTLENFCKYNISVLAGFAGSGKSYSSKALINMLDDLKMNYLLLSPTGRAAKVLSEYTNKKASTIHRGLRYIPNEGFTFNEENKLDIDVVVIDEASMIDVFLMTNLLKAIDTQRTRILFICDPAQIASVSCGNCIQDFISSGIIPINMLTEIFRYGEGGLSYVTSQIRGGEKYLDKGINKPQVFGTNKDYVFIQADGEDIQKYLINLYDGLIKKGKNKEDIIILSAYNKGAYGTYKINEIIQNHINPNILDDPEMYYYRDNNKITFRVSDRVMQTKNNYRAKLYSKDSNLDNDIFDEQMESTTSIFNGDIGTIKKIHNNKITVDFDGVVIEYGKEDINQLLLAYSISLHKCQGSGFKYVILVTPNAHKFFLDRNLLYVGATRAKERVYHIGLYDVVRNSLFKSTNLSRNTFLKDLLLESYNK